MSNVATFWPVDVSHNLAIRAAAWSTGGSSVTAQRPSGLSSADSIEPSSAAIGSAPGPRPA
ncbi:hypothetical protein [Nonomuraea guangzhouensis]|uniref:Uncharacterized protein n=1 Tax=Nonomuraea guangzhouensis TaxID=1291555 RepID=A0ABW4GUF2_9ACTN|nr:hypothetical protein [Nonomuraea guangzhouensis]